MRLGRALKAFWQTLTGAETAQLPAPAPAPAPSKPEPKPAGCDGIALLALLQRDARLIDFVMEPIEGYSDAQIGAAVRSVHSGCQQVLATYLVVEPILAGEEGQKTTIEAGFDPSAVQLTGKVQGDPPFTGALQHHGWRVAKIDFPSRPAGQDPMILTPAEVEL